MFYLGLYIETVDIHKINQLLNLIPLNNNKNFAVFIYLHKITCFSHNKNMHYHILLASP